MNRRHFGLLLCFILITVALIPLVASCGTVPVAYDGLVAGSPTTTDICSDSTTQPPGSTTTTTAGEPGKPGEPGQPGEPTPTTASELGPWFSFDELDQGAMVLQSQFLPALGDGNVERARAVLVDEDKERAETLCADMKEWQKESGSDAAWGGGIWCFTWTGAGYSSDPQLSVPDDLDHWIKAHPDQRAGLQVTMGDNALWWFGMERVAEGSWAFHPGLRDTEYALTHTIAGLRTVVIDATPRPDVHVAVRLRQLPDSGDVSADITIANNSDSLFTLAFADLTLLVDGADAQTIVFPHSPSVLEVEPGQTVQPGNGWNWALEQPVSKTTQLTYLPSDPLSEHRAWVAEAGQ
jgi:hypothetical protein